MLGLTVAYGISALLPIDKDKLVDDQVWRVLLFAPAVIALINILAFVIYYRQEPVGYSLANGNDAEAKKMLRRVYHSKGVDNFDELIEQKNAYVRSNTSKESKAGLCEVIFGAKYRRATWISIFINSMHNLSGINAVNVYITQLLIIKKEETNGEFPITPGSGAFIIAIVNMIGCICALIPMRLIGRKPILMLGYGGLSVSLFVIGLAYLKKWNMLMFITVSVYTFIFQITVSGCTWFYTAETTLDKSMGVCIFV